jgi:DNA-binding CsgD family transcriptional regulator/PAS domain-containing protein
MADVDQVSSLIGDIYDAALDPSLWGSVLEKSTKFAEAAASSLTSWSLTSKVAKVQYSFGVTPEAHRDYEEIYSKIDPRHTGIFFFGVGEVVSSSDIVPYEEMLESRFVREYASPLGWVDVATALLEKSATGLAVWNLVRGEQHGRVDDTMRHRVRLLVPHFRRAVLIGRVIDLKTAEAATFADTLDGLSAGMFLVDETGRIVHANASGHSLLAEGGMLSARGGKLMLKEPNAAREMSATLATARGGDGAVGVNGIAVPLTADDGERYVAHVLPLTSGVRRKAGASYAAVAALFIRKAELDTPSPPEVIAKTFKLTPSELRVLLAIVQVGGVPETAEALGVAEPTVKTHLQRLFAKTGTGRQADLVKLVAGFSNPLVA